MTSANLSLNPRPNQGIRSTSLPLETSPMTGGQPRPRIAPWCDGEAKGSDHVGHQGGSVHSGWSSIFLLYSLLVSTFECDLT